VLKSSRGDLPEAAEGVRLLLHREPPLRGGGSDRIGVIPSEVALGHEGGRPRLP